MIPNTHSANCFPVFSPQTALHVPPDLVWGLALSPFQSLSLATEQVVRRESQRGLVKPPRPTSSGDRANTGGEEPGPEVENLLCDWEQVTSPLWSRFLISKLTGNHLQAHFLLKILGSYHWKNWVCFKGQSSKFLIRGYHSLH